MTTLSKLRFKKNSRGMVASKVFGTKFVSVGFTPDWKGNVGCYYGDGQSTFEVAYGNVGDEDFTVVPHAKRQQVNAVLRNMSLAGRMAVA